MKVVYRHVMFILLILFLLLNVTQMWQNSLIAANASVTPSKSWGIFFNTQGDIEFTVSNSGLAVRILVPREFLNGIGENDTSFLSSTITNDYYYYIVKDGALHYPYKSYAPFVIEVHNPGYATFNPPQKIFLRGISAPRIAGTYNASIYTATSLNAKGLPDFPNAIGENVTIPVSMREDPCRIFGYVKDSYDGRIITSEGIIYARDEDTGKEGKSYVNSTTGFFNITGLYTGEYRLSGSAGYCRATGYAYVTTEYPTKIPLTKGQKTFTNFSLQRGSRINGYLNYLNASFPYAAPIRSVVDNGWFSRAGVAYLNYTVEAYIDEELVSEYTGACQGDKSWDLYWANGTRYSGFGPGTYRLKFWVFGYVQPEEVYVTISSYSETQSRNVSLKNGGVITVTALFPQTPRQLENSVSAGTTGALFGGNILAEAYSPDGVLRGLSIMNYTFANGTVAYADRTEVRFYILGFSDFYNKTYSGVWVKKDYGLGDGQYYVRINLRGFIQKDDITITISSGGNASARIKCLTGGVIEITIESVEINPSTNTPQAVEWAFPGRLLRAWLDKAPMVERGEIFDLRTDDIPLNWPTSTSWYRVEQTKVTIWYTGNNWSTDHIIFFGAVPTALSSKTYGVFAFTYGYIQIVFPSVDLYVSEDFVYGAAPTVSKAYIRLEVGGCVEGTVFFMEDSFPTQVTEKVLLTIKVQDTLGSLKGVQIGAEGPGASFSEFRIYGIYSWKPSGYQLPNHFYYVLPSGERVKDYGLEIGSYNIVIDEFGFNSRFVQTTYPSAIISEAREVISATLEAGKLALVYGNIYGDDQYMQHVLLSWVHVTSNDRSTQSLDGQYRLFLSGGTHTIEYNIPGYNPEQVPLTIHDAGTVGYDVFLEQSGQPFYSIFVRISSVQAVANDEGIECILVAQVDPKEVDPELIQVEWDCNNGVLNSTSGLYVKWLIPKEASNENCTVTATIYIPEYGKIEETIVLDPTNIPEFSSVLATALIFAFSIVVSLGAIKRTKNS